MQNQQITETISRLFIAVDQSNWDELKDIFNSSVLLDYTSMAGGEPATLSAEQIINSWKGLLPGFDATHHQLGNFIVNSGNKMASVFCYGTATHFLKNETGNNIWTVVGSYDFELIEQNVAWKVTQMKFNFKFMDGNSDLPTIAQNRLK